MTKFWISIPVFNSSLLYYARLFKKVINLVLNLKKLFEKIPVTPHVEQALKRNQKESKYYSAGL